MTNAVTAQLEAHHIHCAQGLGETPQLPVAPTLVRDSWISKASMDVGGGGLEPRQWMLYLSCVQEGKAPFTMGVSLTAQERLVGAMAVLQKRERSLLVDGADIVMLVVGRYRIVSPDGPPAQPPAGHGQPLATATTATVVSQKGPGRPEPVDVLSLLDVPVLEATLRDLAKVPLPREVPSATPEEPQGAGETREQPPKPMVVLGLREGALQRASTEAEAAYYGALVEGAQKALQAGLATSGLVCKPAVDRDPETEFESLWLTLDGLAPKGLEFGEECHGAAAQEWFFLAQVSSRGHASAQADQIATPAWPSDVALTRAPFEDQVQLRITLGPRVGSQATPTLLPGLLRAGALSLRLTVPQSEEAAARAALGKISL
ncbi:MAG: hypothetical protein JST92_13945, partial [Deltaproteobacteria bacterium]|nr:hypothetical protein [Deltaproteobacteria bacterium]